MSLTIALTPIEEMVTIFATRVVRCVLNSVKAGFPHVLYRCVSKAEQPMFGMELAHPGLLDPILSHELC